MRAGGIPRRLWIDEPITTQDETGGEVITWEPIGQVWAAIEPVRGREALIAGANLSIMDTKIRIRWSPTVDRVTSKWRGRYGDTVYDIVSVAHLKTGRREIELLCKSGANDG